MAKEYIDRETAANIFSRARRAMRPADYRTFDEMNTRDLMLLNAEQAIRLLPAADVVEVRHAHWRDTGSGQECSLCKEIQYGYDNGRRYCQNCGARMDGNGNV